MDSKKYSNIKISANCCSKKKFCFKFKHLLANKSKQPRKFAITFQNKVMNVNKLGESGSFKAFSLLYVTFN